MILLALEDNAEPVTADDCGPHPDPVAAQFKFGTLLDMCLQVAAVARGIYPLARAAGTASVAAK